MYGLIAHVHLRLSMIIWLLISVMCKHFHTIFQLNTFSDKVQMEKKTIKCVVDSETKLPQKSCMDSCYNAHSFTTRFVIAQTT